ncbi:Nucleotidyltransferase [Entamoeba marina]
MEITYHCNHVDCNDHDLVAFLPLHCINNIYLHFLLHYMIFLHLLYVNMENEGITLLDVELVGSTVKSIIFDDDISFHDIDIALTIDQPKFDLALRCEELTLATLFERDLGIQHFNINGYFLCKTLVDSENPWALISVGSSECTVDVKVSPSPPTCDFSVNSLKLDLLPLISESYCSTAFIRIVSSWGVQMALQDIETKTLRWKDSGIRKIGLRYVLMRTKGYQDTGNGKGEKEFGENIVKEFENKPADYIQQELVKFFTRHYYYNGYQFDGIFEFLNLLLVLLKPYSGIDTLLDVIEMTNQYFQLLSVSSTETYIYSESDD